MNFELKTIAESELQSIVEFLSHNEETSITLMSHFCQNNKPKMPEPHITAFQVLENTKIAAVITISKGGVILHHFESGIIEKHKSELAILIKPIFLQKKIYSIIGEKLGTQFINEIISDFCTVRQRTEYTLMRFSSDFLLATMPPLPKNIALHACHVTDVEKLFCLQAKYELAEVLPPYEKFNSDSCRLNLRHNLGSQHIFALKDTETDAFVAKAGTNAIGFNWVQIGGVFTEEGYRKKGFATFLVHQIAKSMNTNGKKVALFVRVVNETARHAYIKAGFIPSCPFCIYYF